MGKCNRPMKFPHVRIKKKIMHFFLRSQKAFFISTETFPKWTDRDYLFIKEWNRKELPVKRHFNEFLACSGVFRFGFLCVANGIQAHINESAHNFHIQMRIFFFGGSLRQSGICAYGLCMCIQGPDTHNGNPQAFTTPYKIFTVHSQDNTGNRTSERRRQRQRIWKTTRQ